MNKTYKYTLPKGMEVEKTNVRVENGQILVDVELKDKFDPKDGDFCIDLDGDIFIARITDVVYENSIKVYIGTNRKLGNLLYTDGLVSRKGCRYATPEEKSAFLERIEKELHKRWNPETKQLEDIRWKPKDGELYCFVNALGEVKEITYSDTYDFDKKRVEICNCFRTKEAAKPYADQIKEIFKNSKAE